MSGPTAARLFIVSTVGGATQAVPEDHRFVTPQTDNVVAIHLGDDNYVLSTSPSVNDSSLPPVK